MCFIYYYAYKYLAKLVEEHQTSRTRTRCLSIDVCLHKLATVCSDEGHESILTQKERPVWLLQGFHFCGSERL